jgi:hypothetical protein
LDQGQGIREGHFSCLGIGSCTCSIDGIFKGFLQTIVAIGKILSTPIYINKGNLVGSHVFHEATSAVGKWWSGYLGLKVELFTSTSRHAAKLDLRTVDQRKDSKRSSALANAMTTAEVQDFGFSETSVLYSNVRSPGAATNGTARTGVLDGNDDVQGFFTTGLGDAPLDMFKVERAQLNLNITIQQLVVANNILVMASTEAKIYKIDLTLQEQIVGIVSRPPWLWERRLTG